MKNENVIRFQSYDYEEETYYLPRITNAPKVSEFIKANIKTKDDLNINICNECKSCIDDNSCDKIDCEDCLLKLNSSEKYKALKEIFENHKLNFPSIEKSNLPFNNETISEAINCLWKIKECVMDEYDNSDIIDIRKGLASLKEVTQYLFNK